MAFLWLGEDIVDGHLMRCPQCNEGGTSHWEGPNRPVNTSNRGLWVDRCGDGYGCPYSDREDDHDLYIGCGNYYLQCYRCGWFGRALKYPRNLLVVGV